MGVDIAPCRGCGAERDPGIGRGMRYCKACAEAKAKAKLCARCGENPKRPGRGQRLCASCKPAGGPRPCVNCGRDDIPKSARASRYCKVCAPVVSEARKARKRARSRMSTKARQQPCACGRPVGFGRKTRCDLCAAAAERRPPCRACGVRPIRAKRKKYCVECAIVAERARKRYIRERRRRLAMNPEWAERYRTYQRNYKRKNKRRVERRDRERPKVYELPVAPLLVAIDARAERLRAEHGGLTDKELMAAGVPAPATLLMERAGINVRKLYSWRKGEMKAAKVDTVARVLDAIDSEWWEVYDPERWPVEYGLASLAFAGGLALAG